MKYLIIILIVLISSCRKEGQNSLAKYRGEYHLTHIKVSDINFITPNEMEDEVGIKITHNGDLKTFINGKLHRKYKLQKASLKENDTIIAAYKWENNKPISVILYNTNSVLTSIFPYENHNNFFQQK